MRRLPLPRGDKAAFPGAGRRLGRIFGLLLSGHAALHGLWPAPAAAQSLELTLHVVDTKRIAEPSRGFSEPSGLTLAADAAHYWAVSDDTGALFLLAENGKLKPSQSINIGVTGLEGITLDAKKDRLLVVREDSSEVVEVSLADQTVVRHPLAEMAGFDAIADIFGPLRTNSGLEGIAYDAESGEVLVVKEKSPRLLLRLSADLSTVLGVVQLTADRGFSCAGTDDADLDESDIYYDDGRKILWLLSDAGSCILLAEPQTGQIIGRALIAADNDRRKPMKNPEGLSLNAEGNQLRVVTDDGKDSRLIIFSVE